HAWKQEYKYLAGPDGQQHAKRTAEKRQHHRFEEKLPHDIAATRANRFANANLFRSLSHTNEHDIHHADTADQQAQTRDRNRNQSNHRRDAVKLFDKLVSRLNIEVIRIAKLHMTTAAQNFFRLR